MTTFALIPGAGSDASYWDLLAAELRARGHDPVPVQLPSDDDTAGWLEYAKAAQAAIGARDDVVVVAHSLGGFTGPLVASLIPVRLLVMLTAMIPLPGETGNDWWQNTEHYTLDGDTFFNDVPSDITAKADTYERDQSDTPMRQPWPLDAWPDVPTKFLLCRDDRFLPAEFMRRIVRLRLRITPDEMPGGHMVMLSRPAELADRLVGYLTETVPR